MTSTSGKTATAQSAGRSTSGTIVTETAGNRLFRNASPCASRLRDCPARNQDRLDPRFLGHVPLGLQVAQRLDHLAPQADRFAGRFIAEAKGLRPGRDTDALCCRLGL